MSKKMMNGRESLKNESDLKEGYIKMNGRVIVLMIVVTLAHIGVVLTNIAPAKAQERKVGIKVGDWFLYEWNNAWSSDKPNADRPEQVLDWDWYRTEVVSISGTNVTFEDQMHYKDGTDLVGTRLIDVDTGEDSGRWFFFAANLSEGDLVYTEEPNLLVNQTILCEYGGLPRETNFANEFIPMQSYNSGGYYIPYSHNASVSCDYYWDRQIGVLTEILWKIFGQIENGAFDYNITCSAKIIDCNYSEIIPEFHSFLILPLFMITTLLAVIKYRLCACRKKRARA